MPKDVEDRIRKTFSDEDAEIIVRNWSYVSELMFSRSSWARIKREAEMVLRVSRDPEVGKLIPGNPAVAS